MAMDYELGREDIYAASAKVWSFCGKDDIVNGINLRLGIDAREFPFEFGGCKFHDAEQLYLCGKWSDDTDAHKHVQRMITREEGYITGKLLAESRCKNVARADFPSFHLQWMLFSVWQKCKGNAEYRDLLLSLPRDAVIIEDTTRDRLGRRGDWGCKNWELTNKRLNTETVLMHKNKGMERRELKSLINTETNKINDIGVWKGQNNYGKILMACRDSLLQGTEPSIDYELLKAKRIYLFGKLLTFEIK